MKNRSLALLTSTLLTSTLLTSACTTETTDAGGAGGAGTTSATSSSSATSSTTSTTSSTSAATTSASSSSGSSMCGVEPAPGGTTASAGTAGVPQVLATGQAHPGDLTVDDAYVYWVTWDSPATLARVPKEGGPVETLATDLASPWALVLAGDHLYFGDDDDTVKRVPKAGGCVEIIAQGLDTPEYLAVDATHVYFTYPALGEVLKVPRAGGTPTKLATLQAQPEEIVVDDGFVYWVNVDNNSNQGAIRRLPKDATPSDAPTDLATGLIVPRTLKWFGAELVFLTTDGVFDTPAFKLDPALAAAPVFLFDTHGASDLELDVTVNGARFWGAEPKEHAIAYYTVATGVRVEVAKPQPMTQFIASDATHVYWSNNASGEIVRILKP